MTVTTTYRDDVACRPRAGTLYDVIDIILDRGMVIDVFLRVSLVGIEILKIDIRIVIASVDTYLRFAEACDRIDLEADSRSRTVPELLGGIGETARHPVGTAAKKGARKAAKETTHKAKEVLTGGREPDEEPEEEDEEPQEAQEQEAAEAAERRRKRRRERKEPRT